MPATEGNFAAGALADLASNDGGSAEMALARSLAERLDGGDVFNLTTQFGGGKTHFLTLLYHLASSGPGAERWAGVSRILDKAGVRTVPQAATAVFVGTDLDSITGRGGSDGTPVPELRLAVAEPELDVGHVDAVLEALVSSCYYLNAAFSARKNLLSSERLGSSSSWARRSGLRRKASTRLSCFWTLS
jgi:hypothetical protein